MPKPASNLTPMQVCAMELLKKGPTNASQLVHTWHFQQTGRFPPCASRARFGLTSNAYKALRKLVDKQLVTFDRIKDTFALK